MTCFFFFQAEDGIRYLTVTGVQTCALPISACCPSSSINVCSRPTMRLPPRSEERRVGKGVDLGGRRIIKKKKKRTQSKMKKIEKADKQKNNKKENKKKK